MPALQVRDFPQDLYERLKKYAASQHRSLSQQTIVAVQEMLDIADGIQPNVPANTRYAGTVLRPKENIYAPRQETEEEIARRIEKRRRLFEEIDRIPRKKSITDEELHAIVEESRRELEQRGDPLLLDDSENAKNSADCSEE